MALSTGRRVGGGIGRRATVALSGPGGPFPTGTGLCRYPLVHARDRLDEFPGADGPYGEMEPWDLFPARPGLDVIVLRRHRHGIARVIGAGAVVEKERRRRFVAGDSCPAGSGGNRRGAGVDGRTYLRRPMAAEADPAD